MKLLIQPRDGVGPLLDAIKKAKKTIDIVIFRFNRHDIEHALHAAIKRGVVVHALIAHTNKGGAGAAQVRAGKLRTDASIHQASKVSAVFQDPESTSQTTGRLPRPQVRWPAAASGRSPGARAARTSLNVRDGRAR